MPFNQIEFPSQPQSQVDRAHSRTIWKDCPWEEIQNGAKDGIAFFDDFNDLPLTPTLTTQIAYGRYKAYATASDTITNVGVVNSVASPGGILKLLEGANASADNISIAAAYPSFLLSGVTSNSQKLWFECRVAIGSLVANHGAFFVGLGETNLITFTAAVPFTSNTGLALDASGSLIGFVTQMAQTIPGQVNAVYTDRATTFTFPGASNAVDATIGAAFTFTKLGMIYDPSDKDGIAVRFFQDGVLLNSAKVTNAALVALTNLPANPLGLMLSYVAGSAKAATDAVYMDWWRCAQIFTLGGP